MAVFMLDCDSVTSTSSSISSLASQFSQLADSANGYDTSCEDGFDFASAKAAIVANIEACTTKVQNTVKLIEGVVNSHTSLQTTFTIDATNNSNSTTNTGGNSSDTTGTGSYNSNSYSNSGGYSNSYSGGSSGGGYYSGGSAAVAGGVVSEIISQTPSMTNPVDITSKINSVDQVTVDVDKLDEENKTLYIKGMTYNDLGYATYENKYVIVCDKTLANIGDNLVFTKTDGTKVDCVVGAVVDYSPEYKGNVSFIVNDKWNAQGTNNLTIDLNSVKISNNGQFVPTKKEV